MSAVVADTHVLIWYLLESARLSVAAEAALDRATASGAPIYAAAISLVEIIYLSERQRVPAQALSKFKAMLAQPNSAVELVPLDIGVIEAINQVPGDVVREMPDRLIAATALYLNVPLVTKDRQIRATTLTTIW